MNNEELREEALKVSRAANFYGGSFAQKLLGEALVQADANNMRKIYQTWPDLWAQYLKMFNYMQGQR